MSKYKTPKSFGSYLAQLKDDPTGDNFFFWSRFMWMCQIDSIQPHTLTKPHHVWTNLARFYGRDVKQLDSSFFRLLDNHKSSLDYETYLAMQDEF